MGFWYNIWVVAALIVIEFGHVTLSFGQNQDDLRQLRYLSLLIRDRSPSITEAQALHHKEKTIQDFVSEWLDSTEHQQRISRYFRDMLGAHSYFFVADDPFFLEQNEDGVFYSKEKGACQTAQAISKTAWWTNSSSETVLICPNIVSENLSITIDSNYYGCSWADGFLREGCGCGPHQILCYPKRIRHQLMKDLANEFQDRGVYVYQNDLSWHDLFANPSMYGNRSMYHYYLLNQYIIPWQSAPGTEEMAKIWQIPLEEKTWIASPTVGAARAGVATIPAFLKRFNNFRSRVRALSDALLCREVDSGLNTDNNQSLYNPSVMEFDRNIVERQECATCHFGMDNLGAHLFGWNDLGTYQRWPTQLSQVGHAFGITGEGPLDLMEGFIERGPGFIDCMAVRAWEDFSGVSWDTLDTALQEDFRHRAQEGPRSLLTNIFLSPKIQNLRLGTATASSEGSGSDLNFANDIQPILERSCSGSSCHSSDSALGSRYQFVNDESKFRVVPVPRLQDGSMPPTSSGLTLSQEERELLIQFIDP